MLRLVRAALPILTLLVVTNLAQGQYIALPILSDGDNNPDALGIVDNVTLANQSGNGLVAFEGDDEGTALGEEFIFVSNAVNQILIRDGAIIAGPGVALDVITAFSSYRHVDSAGNVVFDGALTGALDVICRNDVAILVEGGASPIGGATYATFENPCMSDAGDIFVESDLSTTTQDEVIVFVPFGGAASILAMNGAGSLFQEGTLIIGGPLDAESWDDVGAFLNETCNSLGTFIVEGELEGALAANECVVRKQVGVDYELLLREGDLVTSPIDGAVPFEAVTEVSLADGNNNWAIRGDLLDSVVTTARDNVVIADVGAGLQVIAQEGQDISVETGITGTTLGAISAAQVNTAGTVVILATVNDDGINLPPYDEAIFTWSAGALTLILTDEVVIPATGFNLTDVLGDSLSISDLGRIVFEGTNSNAAEDGIYEAFLPAVFAVENLACSVTMAGTAAVATWTIPAGQAYDGIRIYENGGLVTTLAGTATTYTTAPVTQSVFVAIGVEPFVGVDNAATLTCGVTVVLPPDFTECATPTPPAPIDSTLPPVVDVLPVVANVSIRDLSVLVQITHTFQGDLDMSLTSPIGTTVEIATDIGGGLDNVNTTFADFGQPILAGSDLSLGNILQPEGPGTMADFQCELSGGNWSLTVDDDAGGDTGTLDMWCLNIYEESSPGLNCCPRPSGFLCANLGACGGPGVDLSWSNNSAYNALELVRNDSGTLTTISLSAAATSFSDATVLAGSSYDYTLRYQCAPGGVFQTAATCTVAVNDTAITGVAGLTCTSDFCGDTVTIAWTNSQPYDTLTLQRAGAFLADVTGLSSFVDTMPNAGSTSYSLIAACGAVTATENCTVDHAFAGPSGLTCTIDSALCDGVVALTWTNNATYDSLSLVVDGVAVVPAPMPTDTSATLGPLAPGTHVIDLIGACSSGSDQVSCTVFAIVPPAGETDCILALEGVQSAPFGDVGVIDSATALANALAANGRTVYVTAPLTATGVITALPCGVDLTTFETIWVMTGTFPDDYRIVAAEGDLLASLAAMGIGIYFEASDHWGFTHVASLLDERDGIEPDIGANIVDGDDSFTQMDGVDAPLAGLLLAGNVDVNYDQDQTGNDFTDQLALTGTTMTATPDAMITSAEAIWTNSNDGLPSATDPDELLAYITGVIAVHADGGRMISQSWEFGGYTGDQNLLAGAYLAALGRMNVPMEQFVRGNCNGLDAQVNIADAVYLLGFLFPGGNPPNVLSCRDACDTNDDGQINIADAVALLGSLFGSPSVPLPFPNATDGCGADPTMDTIDCATNTPSC